jgi:serine/threonine protein kinase
VLIDLGVAREIGQGGTVRGTHAYMAPEQVRGEPWTRATDVFALGVFGIWIAGLASQLLLTGHVIARAGLWPFIIAQALLIAIWLVLHIRRLRDAGQGPTAAIGIALISVLSIGLLLMLVAFFTHPGAVAPRGGESPASNAVIGTLLVVFLFNIVFTPDFGVFSTILKGLILIAFMPVAISLLFSVRTALRKRVPRRSISPSPRAASISSRWTSGRSSSR